MFSKYTIGFIFLIFTVHLVKTKELLNPHDEGDQVILLTQHFIKLNTILNATESLTQGLLNLNQRLDDLNKRQEDHENSVKASLENIIERQDAILNKSETLEQSLLNLTHRQEDHENRIKASQEKCNLNIIEGQDAILNMSETLEQSLLNLTQRQEDHENRVKASQEKFNLKLIERQDAILNKSETLEQSLLNLTQRHEDQKNLLTKYFNQNQQWQTILRRQDGSVDFNRNWTEYEKGFGDPNGEFFIGLQQLYEMTTFGPTQELLVILKDFEGESRYAKYDSFRVGNAAEKYALVEVGKYSGDAGDSLTRHKGYKFSTPDQDNDTSDTANCAKDYKSGWWFMKCYMCNLNGLYKKEAESKNSGVGWNAWKGGKHSLKFAEMKIRSRL